ncbi:hypothetical protein P1P91_00295 [Halomonas piscis]|uniref:Tyr recombinase domain-containing protein n=1 Tax=Halomonas piscis TaxID=3031727 RepID=A0ABY9YZF9_9GAMM|nr:hypothetical protein [Halomonas piscis]WNK20171.1 hypothetical protein P1P91_00295 [Halomonas piscis]
MNDEKYLYPSEIIDSWQEVIDNMNLSQDEADILLSVIYYTQPPLSLESLCNAATVYSHDNSMNIDAVIIDKLKSSDYISHSKPKRKGTSHPVFSALTSPKKLGDTSFPAAQHARLFFSNMFQNKKSGGMVSRSQFYQHAIAVRDVLITLMKTGWDPRNKEHDTKSSLLLATRSDAIFGYADDNFARKVDIFESLIKRELSPGEIQRKHPSFGSRRSRAGKRKRDEWHVIRVETLAKLTKQASSKKQIRCGKDGKSTDLEVAEEQKSDIKAYKVKEPGEDSSEESDVFYIKRLTPSSLTSFDDRQLTRYWLAGASTSSIKNVTDVGRLTPDKIRQVMQLPIKPVLLIYASFLISTGLPPLRLTRMTVSDSSLKEVINSREKRPCWLPHLQLLCYRLLDGPVISETNPAAGWIILHLPESLNSALMKENFDIKKRPFMGARANINQQLKRYGKEIPGITPTANRLSASSWLFCRPNAVDDISAASLSGQFGIGMAAPAAYRTIPREEHQHIFEHALQELGWIDIKMRNMPIKKLDVNKRDIDIAGSSVARNPSEFSAIFDHLKNAMQSPSADLSGWWLGEPMPLASVIELHQLISTREMLAWHLSTGSRPISNNSKIAIDSSLQWIYDKNSSVGRESRVVPLLATIRNSLLSYQKWTNAVINRLNDNSVFVDDQRTENCQTPCWLELSKRGKSLKIRNMKWSDMTKLSLISELHWPTNVCRHSTASWLRLHIPDASVDHLLGHARHGRTLSSPQTEAPLGQQNVLRHWLTEWLKQCAYKPLDWRKMPWM